MRTTQVRTSRLAATGLQTTQVEPGRRESTAPRPARAYLHEHDEEMTNERLITDEITPEEASRLAVTALAADLEFWARTVCVNGRVGLNDLIRTLDLVREAGVPAA
jgi:hypothetical protein